jgi:DNA sulfur modification protein DndE
MFSHIKTSKENKEVITKLTNKLNLGAENVIARIALAYSLEQDDKLDLKDLKDSGGKEYSKSVLFGEHDLVYIGMICSKYSLHNSNKDIQKYLKLHLDEGIKILNNQMNSVNLDFVEFLNLSFGK